MTILLTIKNSWDSLLLKKLLIILITVSIARIRLVYYNWKQVKSFYTRLKDKAPIRDQFGVVYKVPCQCGKSCIGQTRQHLHKRISQHRYDCKRIDLIKQKHNVNGDPPANCTALALHHLNTGHQFLFDNVEILDREKNWKKT